MKNIIAKSSELVVLEHEPGKIYELVSSDHDVRPVIGIFFTGPDAVKLLARLASLRPQDSTRRLLRTIRREAQRNINAGRPKL